MGRPSDYLFRGIENLTRGMQYQQEQAQQDDRFQQGQDQDIIQQGIQGMQHALQQGAQQDMMQKQLQAHLSMEAQREAARAAEAMQERALKLRLGEMDHNDPAKLAQAEWLKAQTSSLPALTEAKVAKTKADAVKAGRPPAPPRPHGDGGEAKLRYQKLVDAVRTSNARLSSLESADARIRSAQQPVGAPPPSMDPALVEERRANKAIRQEFLRQTGLNPDMIGGGGDEDNNPNDADDQVARPKPSALGASPFK